jgi:hypothetical protein
MYPCDYLFNYFTMKVLFEWNLYTYFYRVFREQADWAFILPSQLPTKELRHLPTKMPLRGTTY